MNNRLTIVTIVILLTSLFALDSKISSNKWAMKLVDLLLDQSFVAGVGNKYKSEILFLLKVWPFRLAKDLSSSEQEKLLHKIQEVLKAGHFLFNSCTL